MTADTPESTALALSLGVRLSDPDMLDAEIAFATAAERVRLANERADRERVARMMRGPEL